MYLGLDNDTPDTIMMFKDCPPPDLNATTTSKESPETCVKDLLAALENFTEADFVAALDQDDSEMKDAEASTKGQDNSSDSGSDSGDSKSDESEEEEDSAQSTLTRNEVKKLLQEMRRKEKGGKVRHTSVNTGGVGGTGKAVKEKQPKIKSTEDYANRFKVSIPLREALKIKPNLRGYVANLIADVAHERGLPIRVVKGTEVIEISKE